MHNGQQRSLAKTVFFIMPFVIPFAMFVGAVFFRRFPLFPSWMNFVSAFLFILGVVLLIISKFKNLKSFKMSFGPSTLSEKDKRIYIASYLTMAFAFVLAMFSS